MEHDEIKSALKTDCKSLLVNTLTKPCDGETTESKADKSNQNGTQKESNAGGKPVSGVRQGNVKGRPNSGSSNGSGGDDGEDRRPHLPIGGCKGDDQPVFEDAGIEKKPTADEAVPDDNCTDDHHHHENETAEVKEGTNADKCEELENNFEVDNGNNDFVEKENA